MFFLLGSPFSQLCYYRRNIDSRKSRFHYVDSTTQTLKRKLKRNRFLLLFRPPFWISHASLVVKPLVCQTARRNLVPKLPRVLSFSLKSHGDEVREIPSILTFQKQKCYIEQKEKDAVRKSKQYLWKSLNFKVL